MDNKYYFIIYDYPMFSFNHSNDHGHRRISPLPLSLLAFVATVNSLSCSSETDFKVYENEHGHRLSQIPNVHHMFRRHVSLKKQHEIKQLGVV